MHSRDASFSVRLLGPSLPDQADVDQALNIFVRNTSALLRTKTDQIRAKIKLPDTPKGHFFFTALYRSGAVIGFAMFGYYHRCRLVVIDHMAIDEGHRGHAAFYVFSQLLNDLIQKLDIEVDFTAVELTEGGEFGGDLSGDEGIRLLGQVGFSRVHADYTLANMEPKNFEARYKGVLMLRGAQKIHKIRKEELLEIVHCILFDHYLRWFVDFFGPKIGEYRRHVEVLYQEFEAQLRDTPFVLVNGPEKDELISRPLQPYSYIHEITATWYLVLFAFTAGISTTVVYVLQLPSYLIVPVLVGFLVVFVGVAAASGGKAYDVFERGMSALFKNKFSASESRNSKPKMTKSAKVRKRKSPRNQPDPPNKS